MDDGDGLSDAEIGVRRECDCVPEVEVMVALVVVCDAGMGVDDADGVVDVSWITMRGD